MNRDFLRLPLFSKALAAAAITLLLAGAASAGGKEAGNGGDGIALEFTAFAIQDVRLLQSGQASGAINIGALENAIDSIEVESTDDRLFDRFGIERDALNFPKHEIILLNRDRWRQLTPVAQQQLVLHEYFGILGLKDSQYALTNEVLGDQLNDPACRAKADAAALAESIRIAGTNAVSEWGSELTSRTPDYLVFTSYSETSSTFNAWAVLMSLKCSVLSVTQLY